MAACDFCGATILWGGARDGDFVFCNETCRRQGQAVAVIDQIPPDVTAERLRQVHQGRCPECGGAGPVDVHTSHQVTSVLVMTSWKSNPKVCCRSCGVKNQLGGLAWSAVLGWWGFPWGLLVTPIQIVRNLLGLIRPPQASEPTAQLRKMVNLELASQLADRLIRVTTEVEDVTEAAEVVVECESCSSTFTVAEKLTGCAVTCPECGGPVIAVLDLDEPVPLPELPQRRGTEASRRSRPTSVITLTSSAKETGEQGGVSPPVAVKSRENRGADPLRRTPLAKSRTSENEGGSLWMVLGGVFVAVIALVGAVVFAINVLRAPRGAVVADATTDASAAQPGSAAPVAQDAGSGNLGHGMTELRYGGQRGQGWIYDVKIEIELPDYVETHQGQLMYAITAARDSDFDMQASGRLIRSSQPKRNDPLRIPPAILDDGRFEMFGSRHPQALTLDRTGRLIRQADSKPMPYLLGDSRLLPFERLPNAAQSKWSVSQETQVTLTQFIPLGPHALIGRERASTLGGRETTEYSVKEGTSAVLLLDKKYNLSAGGGDTRLELSGQGWVRFDTTSGSTVASEMRLTLKQTLDNVTVSVPILVTYHQMTGPEIAAQQKPAQVALVASPEAAQVAKPVDAGPPESKELPAGTTVPKVAATQPPAVAKPQTASPTLLDPTDEFVLPQAALDEQGQLWSDEALKPVLQLLREPLGGAAMDAETKLDVGTVVVAKKPGAGDRLAAIREVRDGDKFLVSFLGDKVEPIEATRADLKRPPEQIARFVTASAFAITSKTELRRGLLLETERSGNRWRPVIVLDVLGSGKVKIHYLGWASSWDSEVERSKLRFPTGVASDR